jgi:MoxR-like ATPase
VIQFARQRKRLGELGLSTKKGVLFYGPPGTGKTHTIHYLARAMEGHATLLILAEHVGLLSEYMTLAIASAEHRGHRGRRPDRARSDPHGIGLRGSSAEQAAQRDGRLRPDTDMSFSF